MPMSAILSALADENRREILAVLKQGRISSGELGRQMNLTPVVMTPPALSYHLKKLKEAELIYETRQKNFIFYELDLTVLDEAILWLDELRGGEFHEAEAPLRRGGADDAAEPDSGAGGAALSP